MGSLPKPEQWIWAAGVFAGLLVVGWFVRRMLFRVFSKWSQRTKTTFDDSLVQSTQGPSLLFLFVVAFLVSSRMIDLSEKNDSYVLMGSKVLLIASLIWCIDQIGVGLYRSHPPPFAAVRASPHFLESFIHILIFGFGLLIVLDTIGVSITPLVASLGITSVAVALALQDTLGNFFAGTFLTIDRPLQVGHCIQVEAGGAKGYVYKIGWRSTQIQTLEDNIVVIPNSKLTTGLFTNFSLPTQEIDVLLDFGVENGSDLEQVEEIAEKAAKAVEDGEGGVASFKPFLRYRKFAKSGVEFTLHLRCREYCDQDLLKHRLVKELSRQFAKAKIATC